MIDDFGIYENYINIKWKDILSETNPGLLRKDQKHNLIWVPDALILSSEQMLKDKFFENLVFRDPTNIRTEVIYTLDGKL